MGKVAETEKAMADITTASASNMQEALSNLEKHKVESPTLLKHYSQSQRGKHEELICAVFKKTRLLNCNYFPFTILYLHLSKAH